MCLRPRTTHLWGVLPAALVALGAGPAPATLRLVDDLGQQLDGPVDLCFQVGLRADCRRQMSPGDPVPIPEDYTHVWVEGEHHGPLRLRREEIVPQPDGAIRLVVPRKAILRIVDPPAEGLGLSLYRVDDDSFRRPAFHARITADQARVLVPAGDFVASLAGAGRAPDLQRLRARPAEHVTLHYHPRDGWSLLARCRALATGRLLSRAAVRIEEMKGFGQPQRLIATTQSGSDGLVLHSGLTSPMVSLAVSHAGYLPTSVHGLTATSGTFAFREVELATGGRIHAHVSLHGTPIGDAACEVAVLSQESQWSGAAEPYDVVWTDTTDRRGACRSDSLPAGSYLLRIQVPGSSSRHSRWVAVLEGEDTEEDVALAPTRVTGKVTKAGKPMEGFAVRATYLPPQHPPQGRTEVAAEAVTDESGEYDLTVWMPGVYFLLLRPPSGGHVPGRKRLVAMGDDEHTVDFDVPEAAIRGRVVDDLGRPVEGAWVTLEGWESARAATTGGDGEFAFDPGGDGSGKLQARKSGYLDSAEVLVTVIDGEAPPPVALVLQRSDSARAVVVAANGAPIEGALVNSIVMSTDGPSPYASTKTGADGSFEIQIPNSPAHVLVSGPDCPLTAFEVSASPAEPEGRAPSAVLQCPALPGSIVLTLLDDKARPLPLATILLRAHGVVIPRTILAAHLGQLGLPALTDGRGYVVFAGLAPAYYELFLEDLTSEGRIAAGSDAGYLTTVNLGPLETVELQLTIPGEP